MIAFSDIPNSIKLTVASVAVIMTSLAFMFDTFETAEAAETKWQAHNMAILCRTVYEHGTQVAKLQQQLRFDRSLSPTDKDWLTSEIERLEKEIKRIDSQGVC